MDPATKVLDAFAQRRLIGLLTDDDPALDEDAAYAIAERILQARIARGERPVGRKIGFTNRSTWPDYGVSGPIWGHMYDSTVSSSGDGRATLDVGHLLQPRIEPEVQLHFARTPPVTRDERAILACVDWVALGFEIVQCPFPDWSFRAPDVIAACGVHGALVIGTPVAIDDPDRLRDFTVTLSRDGKPMATGTGANVLDSPLLAYAHLAERLARQDRFPPVQAGEIVTTGTLTPLFPIAAGETWTATPAGIELQELTLGVR
jgi:2-oxo-3-hexenedioate decarboxylase